MPRPLRALRDLEAHLGPRELRLPAEPLRLLGGAFAHPIEFHIHPGLLIVTMIGSLVIVLVAAIIPAYRATRIDVVEALHYE